MLVPFKKYLEEQAWLSGPKRVLVAVSGGRDSMVLCHLLLALDINIGVAHVNFGLRGAESDAEEVLVNDFAVSAGIPCYRTTFATERYAQERKQSIQLVARELRYDWLENIREQHQYDYIATAHHLNDSLETLLFNLAKGTGIRGLHGIPAQQGRIIRPLLFATRQQITDYAQAANISYADDSSNQSQKYHRNLIRQEVVPVLQQINPALVKTMAGNIDRFQEVEWLYDYAVTQWKQQLVQVQGEQVLIDLEALRQLPARVSLLYEWLQPYGFHAAQVAQVFQPGATASGRYFSSVTHELLVDRERLVVRLKGSQEGGDSRWVTEETEEVVLPEGRLRLQILDQSPTSYDRDPAVAYLRWEALAFPLKLRRWTAGDSFQPFGMEGHHQKLQDFFNNAKLSRFDKAQVWLLESRGTICWIVAWRSDERFRVGQADEKVLQLQWIPNM